VQTKVIDLEAASSDPACAASPLAPAEPSSATARLVSGLADAARHMIGCSALSRTGTENTSIIAADNAGTAEVPVAPPVAGETADNAEPQAPPPPAGAVPPPRSRSNSAGSAADFD